MRRAGEHRGQVPGDAVVRTRCGRRIEVGHLLLAEPSIGRVTLRVDCRRDERSHVWTGLTAGEARLLAEALVAQAETVERAC